MREARVVISLDLGEGSDTWVTSVLVPRYANARSSAVTRAAGEALAMFVENVRRERETITERLIEMERRG
jgi:hypothetical protein